MRLSEVATVLAKVTYYSGRSVDEGTIAAWAESLADEITLPDALAAVAAHYGETAAWIMPSHINERVRTTQRERIRVDGSAPIPAGLTYEQERAWRPIYHAQIRQGVDRAGATMAANHAMGLPDALELERPVLQAIEGLASRWTA